MMAYVSYRDASLMIGLYAFVVAICEYVCENLNRYINVAILRETLECRAARIKNIKADVHSYDKFTNIALPGACACIDQTCSVLILLSRDDTS